CCPWVRLDCSDKPGLGFWKILLKGPPETPYENGVFELYCEFGAEYPVKPPVMKFLTPIYHCNVNSVGRICHNIFDRNYSAQITMREILDAVYGLLICNILLKDYSNWIERYVQKGEGS
uniref:UBC core domain-containing protein n=1 Tax=Astyanax mexicanus TaxID=7994 RepID=A0A8B9JCA6_ASTMX